MKKTLLILIAAVATLAAHAQNTYWVFLTDKAGTTFDPYAYFDARALERYAQCGADPADLSNHPVSTAYEQGVGALATEHVGSSRWLNAVGIVATPDQVAQIEALPYVRRVQLIASRATLAHIQNSTFEIQNSAPDTTLTDQLVRMQGHLFRQQGIDGSGMRIAVFDGGFPKVNTHEAFEHLRRAGRILKTWNFPDKKEDVYGWNGHGTMTLSCIAGRMNGRDLGLATGAEFLLARTEVEPEPFKEEIWWMQAMEWADKNGAQIISSSLGYGKDRYYTKDMDGTSYVARAANMAARKGILVCSSAGNEGDDRSWKTIVTPSDADSVLCVGGTTHDLDRYMHIDFASYGPSADGRQKPNVCAFGHAWAANPHGKGGYQMVYGTSFSCPLVAGFAACAWQMNRDKTAMQMFDLIQRSADLYPYCDYAFGYGVPQASFFTQKSELKNHNSPTFRFERQSATRVSVIPLRTDTTLRFFFKDVAADGSITNYGQREIIEATPGLSLDFDGGTRLVVHLNGYTADYTFDQPSAPPADRWSQIGFEQSKGSYKLPVAVRHTPALERPKETRWAYDAYFMFGRPIAIGDDELASNLWSPAWHIGTRISYHLTKAYSLGLGLGWAKTFYHFGDRDVNKLEQLLNRPTDRFINVGNVEVTRRRLSLGEWNFELFQRIRFQPGGLNHKGFHWDLGVYGSLGYTTYRIKGTIEGNGTIAAAREEILEGPTALDTYNFNFGLATRLTYHYYGIYARYRLNGIGSDVPADKVLLPRLEVGLQLMF